MRKTCPAETNGIKADPEGSARYVFNRMGRFWLVGVRGFEPPTPSSRTTCGTRLRYTPIQRSAI